MKPPEVFKNLKFQASEKFTVQYKTFISTVRTSLGEAITHVFKANIHDRARTRIKLC